VLRELYRLMNPLQVSGTFPLIELGETVRVRSTMMGLDETYVVDRVSREPLFRYDAALVPYRFSSLATPAPPVIPVRTTFVPLLAPNCVMLGTGSGGGGDEGSAPYALYRTTEGVNSTSNLVISWESLVAGGPLLVHSSPDAPLIIGGGPDGQLMIETSADQHLAAPGDFVAPVHVFMVVNLVATTFSDNAPFLTFGGFNDGYQVCWGSDQNTVTLRVGDPAVADEIVSTNGGSGWITIEAVLNGAGSKLSVNEQTLLTGDIGTGPLSPLRLGPNTGGLDINWAELRIYNGERTTEQRAAIYADINTFWDL
jgi:hypothetical protein